MARSKQTKRRELFSYSPHVVSLVTQREHPCAEPAYSAAQTKEESELHALLYELCKAFQSQSDVAADRGITSVLFTDPRESAWLSITLTTLQLCFAIFAADPTSPRRSQ